MPEKPKREREEKEKGSWAEDQEKHEYYYDDAHGYENYAPEELEDDEQEDNDGQATA